MDNYKATEYSEDKIIMLLAPFWTPLIPPLGISCLKSFLQDNGYHVKLFDSNTNDIFRSLYEEYFDTLKKHIPQEVCGNYYKIGRPVLRNHMMAHIRSTDRLKYMELIKTIVYKNFYYEINDSTVTELISIIDKFYPIYEQYILDILNNEKPKIVGITTYSDTLPASLFAFDVIKRHNPN